MDHTQLTEYYEDQLSLLLRVLRETNWNGLEHWLEAQNTYREPWVTLTDFRSLRSAAERIIERR